MKLQVLLADDHALFRDGMRYVLQQLCEQVDIICAGNFAETLKQAETNPGIDLALIDLNMPGSDGVASIRIFHQRFPGIPLVVVSGSEQRTEIECVMEYDAQGIDHFFARRHFGNKTHCTIFHYTFNFSALFRP